MKIAFYGNGLINGAEIPRAKWPSAWVNKFTTHSAFYYTMADLGEAGHFDTFRRVDAVVFHKQHPKFINAARHIREHHPGVLVLFDIDDADWLTYDRHYCEYVFHGYDLKPKYSEFAHGLICSTTVLAECFADELPVAVIGNGFDLTVSAWAHFQDAYFDGFDKIVWGGGISHFRDLAMLMKIGDLDRLLDERTADVYLYGVTQQDFRLQRGTGRLCAFRGASMDQYIKRFYRTASLCIAPLIRDPFNDHRSTLKLVEAGVVGVPIVASDVACYRSYECPEAVTLVDNSPGSWYTAITELLDNPDERARRGKLNRECVEQFYSAETLTQSRIQFIESLR